MAFGISDAALNGIHSVFTGSRKVHRVRIFGSRAMGRQREGSDIDLAIEGEALTLDDLLDLRLGLENLQLPYRFDLLDLAMVDEPALRDHIERVGQVVFER